MSEAKAKKPATRGVPLPSIDIAPDVDVQPADDPALLFHRQQMMTYNPKFRSLQAAAPGATFGQQLENKTLVGSFSTAHTSDFAFMREYNSFQNFGFGEDGTMVHAPQEKKGEIDPKNPAYGSTVTWGVVDHKRLASGIGTFDSRGVSSRAEKRQKSGRPDDTEGGFKGPWARYEGEEERDAYHKEMQAHREAETRRLEKEKKLAKEGAKAAAQSDEDNELLAEEKPMPTPEETSQFHGKKKEKWVDAGKRSKGAREAAATAQAMESNPEGLATHSCHLPKKWIYTFSGHEGAVQAVRLFPKTAHLFLTCGADKTVKIWDYYGDRQCKQTYAHHTEMVRQVRFTNDGKNFYSCGYDKRLLYWDTETGQVIRDLDVQSRMYCLAVGVEQTSVLVGCQNKKAIQYDMNSGKMEVEYNEHLGAVNTVTLVDGGRRVVTTSDDRKIFVWGYAQPQVEKYLSEPSMHAVSAACMHPSQKWMLGQSMDNTIVTFQAEGGFRPFTRKKFRGHVNTGFAIEPCMSPDGRFVCSGDGEGRVHFWDWHKTKLLRSLRAHDQVPICSVWHPTQPSRVLTASWDGTVKLWE